MQARARNIWAQILACQACKFRFSELMCIAWLLVKVLTDGREVLVSIVMDVLKLGSHEAKATTTANMYQCCTTPILVDMDPRPSRSVSVFFRANWYSAAELAGTAWLVTVPRICRIYPMCTIGSAQCSQAQRYSIQNLTYLA